MDAIWYDYNKKGGPVRLHAAVRPDGPYVYFQLFPAGEPHIDGKEAVYLTKEQALEFSKMFKDAAENIELGRTLYVTDKHGDFYKFVNPIKFEMSEG